MCVRDREEFGARALGNRSIIADPSKLAVIKKINEVRNLYQKKCYIFCNVNHQLNLVVAPFQ